MEELVRHMINHLVDSPDKIDIKAEEDNIIVTVPKAEMGKIIGKQGRIAKALRTIVKAASTGEKKINLEIIEAGEAQ